MSVILPFLGMPASSTVHVCVSTTHHIQSHKPKTEPIANGKDHNQLPSRHHGIVLLCGSTLEGSLNRKLCTVHVRVGRSFRHSAFLGTLSVHSKESFRSHYYFSSVYFEDRDWPLESSFPDGGLDWPPRRD